MRCLAQFLFGAECHQHATRRSITSELSSKPLSPAGATESALRNVKNESTMQLVLSAFTTVQIKSCQAKLDDLLFVQVGGSSSMPPHPQKVRRAFTPPLDVYLSKTADTGQAFVGQAGIPCPHCGSLRATELKLPNGTKTDVCNACFRRFAKQVRPRRKYSAAVKVRILSMYMAGGENGSVRGIANELGISPRGVQHVIDKYAMKCKSPLDRAVELGLKPSEYIEVDKTVQKVKGKWHSVLVVADPVPFYTYVYELLDKQSLTRENERRLLTEVTKQHLKAVKDKLNWKPVLAVTDDDESQITAIREVFGKQIAIQLCIWHVLNHMDKLMPTKRNPKVTRGTRALWERFKAEVKGVLLAPTREEFDRRLRQLLEEKEWRSNARTIKAINYLTDRYEMLVAHFKFPGAPRTTGVVERLIEEMKGWLREKRGFKDLSLARRKNYLKVNYLNHSKFTSSKTGLNRKSPAELAGAPPGASWLDCIEGGITDD